MTSRELFETAVREEASDLFVKVGAPPALRVAGRLRALSLPAVTPEFGEALLQEVLPPRLQAAFAERGEADIAHEVAGIGRFRCNAFRQRGALGFVFRLVNRVIPALDALGLPTGTLERLCGLSRGLVLVTGTTGSGKSTTLAAMIGRIAATQPKHVVTIEDPIEYVFADAKALVEQRELGIDTLSYEAALRAVVRQSPDVIMIGELRDRETIEAALHAAETGHLVLSTLHTRNAAQTVERILNFFPPHQHEFIRNQLALQLEAVVSQRLLPRADGRGRAAAAEVLVRTPTLQDLLAKGRFAEMPKALAAGAYFGTQTFNQSLRALMDAGTIALDEALAASDHPEELKLEMKGIGGGARPATDSELRIGR
ncbi:MAG: PilT/PilU family type 4a pilus ATPase [Planctomycetia bacterium]|nr:PilT/PilU family type 4a pilus ATPase [Planctomycetia bacterium]